MGTPSDQTADLPARVAQWIAGGETYEVEFKGEQRERRPVTANRSANISSGNKTEHSRCSSAYTESGATLPSQKTAVEANEPPWRGVTPSVIP